MTTRFPPPEIERQTAPDYITMAALRIIHAKASGIVLLESRRSMNADSAVMKAADDILVATQAVMDRLGITSL